MVALFHYLGSGLGFALISIVAGSSGGIDTYPAFAKSLFDRPREATGKIVCSNCHLGSDELIISLPQGVLAGDSFEVGFQIPLKKTNAQLQSDGSVGPLQVGGVLVLPEMIDIEENQDWSYWSNKEKESVSFGPREAELSVQVVSLQVSRESLPSSVTVYGGGNRGRGQLYPDGTPSNINNQRFEIGGIITSLSSKTKRYGYVYGMLTSVGSRDIGRTEPGQTIDVALSTGAISQTGAITGYGRNMGGFGLSEGTLTIQENAILGNYLAVVLLIQGTQLGLVLKKKQYERLNI